MKRKKTDAGPFALHEFIEGSEVSKGTLSIQAADLNLLKALQRHGVPFVIIGGHAVRFHGVDRDVADLDVLVDAAGRAENLGAAIREVGGDLSRIDVTEIGKPYKQIPVKYKGMNSEILTAAPGIEFAEVYRVAHALEVEGLTLRVMSKDHLIRNKRAVGRDKDLRDVERLEASAR